MKDWTKKKMQKFVIWILISYQSMAWRQHNTRAAPMQWPFANVWTRFIGVLVYKSTCEQCVCVFVVVVVCVWLVVVTFFVVLTILPLEIPSCHFFHFVQCALCAASDSANFILLPVLCLIGNHHCLAEAIHVWGGLGRCICVHLLIFEHNNIQIFDRKHHLTSLSIRVFRFLAGENIYFFFFSTSFCMMQMRVNKIDSFRVWKMIGEYFMNEYDSPWEWSPEPNHDIRYFTDTFRCDELCILRTR